MGSTRFPGKTLAPFGDSTVLQHLLGRLRRATVSMALAIATSDLPEDDAIATVAERDGVAVVRGPAEDVLERFALAIGELGEPELILRICADRPLLCPVLVDELVGAYDELGRPDYVSNNLPPGYPDGLDLELVRTECLVKAAADAVDPYEREHVTPFVYRRPEQFSLETLACPFGNYSDIRLALDTPDDHRRLLRLHDELVQHDRDYDYRDMLNVATLRPDLAA